jgi:SAM-dependent methyltransferase
MPDPSKKMTDPKMGAILSRLGELQKKPAAFARGEAIFWDDPHISTCMLAAHLDPETDAASRRPETIDRSTTWLIEKLQLSAGSTLLDLGCGPGLYASRFAKAGLKVTGIDYSRRSIAFASACAKENNLDIAYRYQDYLTLDDAGRYDTALLIYGDFCPLDPLQRATLLANVRRALRPGGRFVLDVSTRVCRQKHHIQHGWRALESGFWNANPHLLLEDGFDYPEESIWLDQAIVLTEDGRVVVYRNWFQDYTVETITTELEDNGFAVDGHWGDFCGLAYTPESEWIALITHKK